MNVHGFRFVACVVAVGALGLICGAGEIAVGAGRTRAIDTAADAVQGDAVRVADRAVIEKTGAGTLTLRTGAFAENMPATVNVREGAVRLEASEPLVTAYPEPTEILNRAAFWMDATRNVQIKEGSADEVAAWFDVRETGDGSEENPFTRTRAVPFLNRWLTAYPLRQIYQGKTGVWFRGIGSGCFMNWVNPDGSQATVKNIRHVFVVHGGPMGRGTFLGQRAWVEPYFHRRREEDGDTDALWVRNSYENRPLFASRTYLNGCEADILRTTYPHDSINLVEVEALEWSLAAMCFYNDRDMQTTATDGTKPVGKVTTAEGEKEVTFSVIFDANDGREGGDRAGGENLYEVVLFDTQLTVAERMAVSAWLNQKWRNVAPPAAMPEATVGLATNTTVELAGNFPAAVAVRGDGVVRKTGDGAATIRSSYEPRNAARRVEVEGGALNLGYALPLVCAAGDTITSVRRLYGPEIVPPKSGEDKTRLVKEGNGPITLDAIPAGVTRLDVKGGELRLADPERAQLAVPGRTVHATIPDADFEGYPASAHSEAYFYVVSDTANGGTGEAWGWHAIVPGQNGKESAVMFFDQSKGSPAWWNMMMQDEASGVLVVKNNASVWCEIQVPEEGDYRLSFRAAPRNGDFAGRQLDVMIGPNAESLALVGAFITSSACADWSTYAFQKVHLTAGTHQLWLKSNELNDDRCTQFDDFCLEKVEEGATVWEIPNGGFESHDAAFCATQLAIANADHVPGFVVRQGASVDEPSEYGFATFTSRGVDGDWLFNLPWNRAGSATQFHMTGNGVQLETTFTPPAGSWNLRADLCTWWPGWRSMIVYNVSAQLTVGDATIDLGEVADAGSAKLIPRDWPNAFTVDGKTPVTLTLTGANPWGYGGGHCLLDNLTLVRPANLLRDGGFENGSAWATTVTPKPGGFTGSIVLGYTNNNYKTFFGQEWFEGNNCAVLVNDDVIAQRVTFPTGGLYRFSANMESRDWSDNGKQDRFLKGLNPVAFFVAQDGVTNWLGCTDQVKMTNFHEYAYNVRIPEAGGAYDVGFRGRSVWDGGDSQLDRSTLIDGVQLYRIEAERPIELPRKLEIDVAAGAQLTLDFDGKREVQQLKIAGKSYLGEISLATHPELLGTLNGCGTLVVRPRNTVLFLR